MRENVFEIISHLVKRLLYSEDLVNDEEKLIQSLREEGYDLAEISQAFEFIFSTSEIIEVSGDNQKSLRKEADYEVNINSRSFNRVFNFRERLKLSLGVQGVIIKLLALNLINGEEVELVISKCLVEYSSIVNLIDFWKALELVIDDEFRLALITRKVEELNGLDESKGKYIN
ncbi:DUF494 family protein [Halonatronum saccharophilum]|uniref:DUF494 family protein n=1 Tax=Halonatronum saccharophilum TaxID=150060 RepID=UPI0004843E06|nr:DUF494 family protein [Halonatronum saccharophilum]